MINPVVLVKPEGPCHLIDDIESGCSLGCFGESTVQNVDERISVHQVARVRIRFEKESVPSPTALGFEAMKLENVFRGFPNAWARRAKSIPMAKFMSSI